MNTIFRFAVVAVLAGCSTTPHYDKHFGDAVRQAKISMTINPNAAANPDPAAGIDGQSAASALKRYIDPPPPPAPPPTLSITLK